MGKQQCSSSTEQNYSAPMPTIGLYIAAASLVCLLFLIHDMVCGFRRRQPWLPCRFFSVNSFTLTLLAIATKLPVDLTTPMPSVIDQLSKLCGTLFICISMGFFMPSLGNMKDSELFANMASLSVLVIAVIFNIYMQIATGVIFTHFIVEHVLLLSLMWLTLMAMWYVTFNIYWVTEKGNDYWRSGLEKHYKGGNMIQGLRHCYFRSHFSNPQLRVCAFTHYATVGKWCTYAPLILIEAGVRTYIMDLKFCAGVSDYKWSMWVVFVTQIITIVIGSFAITFRWFFSESCKDPFQRMNWDCARFQDYKVVATLLLNRKVYSLPLNFSRMSTVKTIEVLVNVLIYVSFVKEIVMLWMDRVATVAAWVVKKFCAWVAGHTIKTLEIIYLHSKVREDIESLVEKYRQVPMNNITQLLSTTSPSLGSHSHDKGNNCLLLVLLVRVAAVATPSDLHKLLIHALDEAFEIAHFIEKRVNSFSFKCVCKRVVANDLWKSRHFHNHWFQKKLVIPLQEKYPVRIHNSADAESQSQADLDRAFGIIEEFMMTLKNIPCCFSDEECCIILKFIEKGRCNSVKEIYDRIEQLFVDTMHRVLTQLPSVIFEYVSKSSYAELEERARTALEFQSQFDLLKAQVEWLSPVVSSIPSKVTNTHDIPPMEDSDDVVVVRSSGTEDVDEDVHIAHHYETVAEDE